ncbi:MAG: bifunctional alpha,alpha-trehalose-phosphate synthase (UDP-forming)/trehalose-phosphatase [Planctomycetota bacterium]|jgi:trehalose 6-phosphate synthase/phosphatase
MGRLLVIANRLPFSMTKRAGEFHFRPNAGGLAVGLSSLPESIDRLWIGWPGMANEKLTAKDRARVQKRLAAENCLPVFLSKKQIEQYYLGFCNETIWPLFHYFPTRTLWESRFWQVYEQVNHTFCRETLKVARPGDRIWVHDYQLMLLPQLLREKLPDVEIGFFLHIPWPSYELFRLLPWREDILNGLLGADLIGFHTYDYVRHFLSSVCRIVGIEHMLSKLHVHNRIVRVDAFPMGIAYDKYAQATDKPEVKSEVEKIQTKIGNRRMIISIDRLDYTKGIIERLEAFDLFLSENPQYRGQVTLIMVAVPSRTGVQDYQMLREKLEHLVGRVNGEHGSIGYVPVWYLYRFLAFNQIAALYNVADVALVTPLRDGMNLIAKEFVASKTDGTGVLILGEMTGAASELGEALIVNANNKQAIIEAIKEALEMPVSEQVERNRAMQQRLRRYDIARWSNDFIEAISEVKRVQNEFSVRKLSNDTKLEMKAQCVQASKRLFLLDYDGTLVGFRGKPADAGPDAEVTALLERLAGDKRNTVVVISGRDKQTLENWLGALDVRLVAEHGAWIQQADSTWDHVDPMMTTGWKREIKPILELYSDRTPGSFVEEKEFSLVWHFRRAAPELAYVRTQELRGAVLDLTTNLDIGVFEGSKILEVRQLGINKGRAAERWLAAGQWDFVTAAGDDYTDEEMFAVMPQHAYSIKVGIGISKARFNVDTVSEFRTLLEELFGDESIC